MHPWVKAVSWVVCGWLCLAGCAHGPAGAGTEGAASARAGGRAEARGQKRSQIVPLVEHHQHIVGPMQLTPPDPPLPTIKLPPELERVVRERERISGTRSLGEAFTEDAQVLDVSRGEDTWARGRFAIERLVNAHSADTRFVPNTYRVDGSAGYIAGTVRSGESTEDEMHFAFGLVKDAKGTWRIALEYATNKPPVTFAAPITADDLIRHLDDAGIERAVVLSVAYWLGSPLGEKPVENEHAKVREANDWTIDQVNRHPDRLFAFCGVNPLRDYAIEELVRCSKVPRVKGMKLHFGNSGVDVRKPEHVARLRRFFRAANEHRMALAIHLWTLDRSYGAEHSKIFLEQLLPETPDITVQIAHLAGAGRYVHDDALEVFANALTAGDPRMKNVWFDLTTVVSHTDKPETLALVAKRLRQIGLERVVFGADTAVASRPPPLLAWAAVRRLPLTDDELRIIANNVAPYLR
jgi:predicted TIM-barrel fold metal-dependent hydrolase